MFGRKERGRPEGEEAKKKAAETVAVHHFDYSPVKSTLKTATSYWTCRKGGETCGDKQKMAILALFCTSCVAFLGAILLWTWDVSNTLILNGLVIENETQLYEWWRDPPANTTFKMRLFNYTNSEAYLNRTEEKLRVKELGPYTYRMTRQKVYVEFDEDEGGETVSFQENRSYVFLPEMSPGVSEDDLVTVPNMALLGAASVMHDSYYLVRMGLATILKTLKVEPFLQLKVGEFFWGYDDTLFDLAKTIVPSLKDVPFDKFGVMASINGISKDRMTIHTGLKNRSMLGIISKVNDEDSLPYWNDYECNRVDGSEGTLFPLLALPKITNFQEQEQYNTNSIREPHQHRITIFNHELCRRFPLEPTEIVEAFGFPAIRFRPPVGVFDDAIKNPENKCFCDPEQSVCPPSGVFNVTPCAYGGPIMASFPHFYMGEKSLLEPFEGLNPRKDLHEFTIDIQTVLGVPLGGTSRLQLNVMVRKSKGIWQLDGFPKNLILPIIWFEMEVEGLPEYVTDAIRMGTETVQLVQKIMRWSLLVLSLVLMIIVIVLIMKRIRIGCRKKECANMVMFSDHGKPETMAFLQKAS